MEEERKEEELQEEVKEEAAPEAQEEPQADEPETAEAEADTPEEAAEAPEESEEPEEAPEAAEAADAGKGGIFKKKKKKDKQEEKIAELEDRVKRQMAEFDNFRKRTEKEKSHMYEVGARDVIEKILPVVDSFERGLSSVPEEEKENPVIEGMDKIYRQLMTALTDLGVEPIEAAGKEFDPNFHNAVMHVEDEAFGENIVAEEFQKGYKYKDAVVRHSMVKVAN